MKKIFLAVVLIGLLLVLGYGVYSTVTQSKGTSAKAGLGDTIDKVDEITEVVHAAARKYSKEADEVTFLGTNGQFVLFKVSGKVTLKNNDSKRPLLAVLQTEDFVNFKNVKYKFGLTEKSEIEFNNFGSEVGSLIRISRDGNKGTFLYDGKQLKLIRDAKYISFRDYVVDGKGAFRVENIHSSYYGGPTKYKIYKLQSDTTEKEVYSFNDLRAEDCEKPELLAVGEGKLFAWSRCNKGEKDEGLLAYASKSKASDLARVYPKFEKGGNLNRLEAFHSSGGKLLARFDEICNDGNYSASVFGDDALPSSFKFSLLDITKDLKFSCSYGSWDKGNILYFGGFKSTLIFVNGRNKLEKKDEFRLMGVKDDLTVEDLTSFIQTKIGAKLKVIQPFAAYIKGLNAWYFSLGEQQSMNGGKANSPTRLLLYSGI